MKLFFAGCEAKQHAQSAINNGVTSILESAFYLNYKRPPNRFSAKCHVLDSGGFTSRKKGTIINVEKYAEYLNQFDVKVAFNLDTSNTDETLHNQEYLEKNTKCYIIPIYHYSEFIVPRYQGLLVDYAKKYHYIGLGGTAEGATGITHNKLAFFDFCFSTVGIRNKIHGLAVTSFKLMLRYPWFSVDSTSWLSAEAYGKFIDFKDGRFVGLDSIRKQGGTFTDPRQLLSSHDRVNTSVKAYLKAEKYITQYWASKGVRWDEKPYC